MYWWKKDDKIHSISEMLGTRLGGCVLLIPIIDFSGAKTLFKCES